VFFDNEENGLLGSAFFRKLHKKDGLNNKLMINYDCVSDGEHMLFVLNKPALKAYGDDFVSAFPNTAEVTAHVESSSDTMYPSDQAGFPVGVGVAAMKKKRFVGLYIDRIHTIRDTVMRRENIEYLINGTLRLLDKLRGEGQ
jgi:Zn-dependent M28 family amino/carboxypeptidase